MLAADPSAAPAAAAVADPDGPDAVRLTWNTWPRLKVEASRCIVPLAAAISPARVPDPSAASPPPLPYPPLRCEPPCSALLNPFARVDFAAKIWICPLCFSRNHFPPHYAAISESNVPAELFPQCSTVSTTLPLPTCVVCRRKPWPQSPIARVIQVSLAAALQLPR